MDSPPAHAPIPDPPPSASASPTGAAPAVKTSDTLARVEEFRQRHRTSLLTLLFTDLVGSTKLKQDRGDIDAVALMQAHAAMVREVLAGFPEGQEISTAGDAFFCVFVRPSDAVRFALGVQSRTRGEFTGLCGLAIRIGIHLGEVVVEERATETKPLDLFGLQVDTAARVQSLAGGDQILLTRSVFDNARQVLKGRNAGVRRGSDAGVRPGSDAGVRRGSDAPAAGPTPLVWLNHGPYLVKGVEDPIEVCEVGEEGLAALRAPGPSEKAHPAGLSEEELGWRPAPEIKIPGTAWVLVDRLGEGGFGEVWRARHPQTGETRVFKFCFLKERLHTLRRELALFRLLREKVGDHPNIVRLHDVFLDSAPYYLAMEDVPGRNLSEWLAGTAGGDGPARPRIKTLPLRAKLGIAAQVADALGAAAKAGVIHQDVKPANILVDESVPASPDGAPKIKLSDFGVGRVVNEEILGKLTLTGLGKSVVLTAPTGSESGTLLYMAPERLEGKQATPQSDLYSLGVVLFQMVAGDLDRAVTLDWESEVPDPTLQGDLRKVLAGTPERRIASGAEFASRMRSWPLRRRMRGVKRAVVSVCLMLATALVAFVWHSKRLAEEELKRGEAETRAVEEQRLRGRAEAAEVTAQALRRKFQAEAELLKARAEENAGDRMSALAHAVASLRVQPDPQAADLAWRLRVPTGSLLWASPRTGHHTGPVAAVALSPDGTRIVSGSHDTTLRLWDAATGKETARLTGHRDRVLSVAFSPDGTRIASGSKDTTVRIWDVATGRETACLRGHTDMVSSVAFSPDGTRIASGSDDLTVRLWDVASGKEIRSIEGHSSGVLSVAFSPDGDRVASGSYDKTVRIRDVASGKEIAHFGGHADAVGSVAFSADGTRLVSGSHDKTLRIWDAASGKEAHRLEGHTGLVSSVLFSRDGLRVISGSADGTVRIWDAGTGGETARFEGDASGVDSIALSPDGRRIVSGAEDGMIRLWEIPVRNVTARLEGHTDFVVSVAFSPDGKRVASGSQDNTIRVWDAASGAELALLAGHTGTVSSVAFSPDGTRIASGSWDDTLRLWDPATGKESRCIEGQCSGVTAVVFSPDGTRLASGSGDKRVRLWDTATGRTIACLEGHTDMVSSVAFGSDGTRIVSGSWDDTVRLWDVAAGKDLACFKGHTGDIGAVAYSPDGKRIVSGSRDTTLRVWDVATAKETLRLEGHRDMILAVAFSPDGTRIASGSADHTIRVWDLPAEASAQAGAATGKEIACLEGHADAVNSIAFSPDGTRIVSGSDDHGVRFWDVATGKEVLCAAGHVQAVESLAFSPDGSRAASRDGSGRTILWDVATGRSLADAGGAEAERLLKACAATRGPTGPTRLSGLGAVLVEGEAEWRTAWYDPEKDGNGLPRRVARIFDRWEREIARRINLDTGETERIAVPGSAYANDPTIAPGRR